jgi:hypothetical protein
MTALGKSGESMARRAFLVAAVIVAGCGDLTLPWTSGPTAASPVFSVTPTSLSFDVPRNYTDISLRLQTVWLRNERTGFHVLVEYDSPAILSVTGGGTPMPGRGQDVTVMVQDPGVLGPGTYSGQVRFQPIDASTGAPVVGVQALTVDVTYVVPQ